MKILDTGVVRDTTTQRSGSSIQLCACINPAFLCGQLIVLPLPLTVPGNIKLALDVCHPYDAASYMSLLSTISIFF